MSEAMPGEAAPGGSGWPIGIRAILGMAGFGPGPDAVRAAVQGRVVVVTGASRGVGERVAIRLGAVGAHVVLLARGDGVDAAAEQVRSSGGTASTYRIDLRDPAAARATAELMLAECGTPAVVISNAGHSIRRPLAQYLDRFHDVQRLMGVNALGPIALLLPLLREMTAARSGHLISVSSASVDVPSPGYSAYAASKAAFEAWLRALAPELSAEGVAATSIHLPLVHTAMSAPTTAYARAPGLTADGAAALVCRAIVEKPRLISPWWARAGGLIGAAAPAAADRLFGSAILRGRW
ncbi:SDR family NAD(P)-dependent oxidoreductase [Ruania halotolerans]|uniref:SDR family NAD(P)-dependent oxidoreductase n=1 Tax=Ruania halotolerans TaxID=2897773 RepID=UPI001E544CAD|nr:SDR family NAD(P)-dependent oxidoreductase [Ruania halotolerans]UFU05254.1 SDR family NAD(P)-dependent oxidoreductase [Ruania halotolerans]